MLLSDQVKKRLLPLKMNSLMVIQVYLSALESLDENDFSTVEVEQVSLECFMGDETGRQ